MTDKQRAAFEAIFPVPKNCIWCGDGYLPTEYSAWDAANYAERFKGFLAALASPEVQALREALIESDNQLKQVLASNTDGLVHVVNDEFHLCLEKNRSALAAMEKQP